MICWETIPPQGASQPYWSIMDGVNTTSQGRSLPRNHWPEQENSLSQWPCVHDQDKLQSYHGMDNINSLQRDGPKKLHDNRPNNRFMSDARQEHDGKISIGCPIFLFACESWTLTADL